MVAEDTASPPSEAELHAEIRRLQHFLACWNIGASERLAARLSLRIARAAMAATAGISGGEGPNAAMPPASQSSSSAAQVVDALVSDLKHLVRWHDQLGPVDISRAEATIAMAEGKVALSAWPDERRLRAADAVVRFATDRHGASPDYQEAMLVVNVVLGTSAKDQADA